MSFVMCFKKIKQIYIYIAFSFFLASCSNESNTSNDAITTEAGIYFGPVVVSDKFTFKSVMLISEANDIYLFDVDGGGLLKGKISGSTFIGPIFPSSSSSDIASGEFTMFSRGNVTGKYSTPYLNGVFSFVADQELFNRTSSLSLLDGTWTGNGIIDKQATSTWVIQSDGSFIISSTDSCTANGNFSLLNTAKNQYVITLTLENCMPYNGVYSGMAYVTDDVFTNDSLFSVYSSDLFAGLSDLTRQ